MSAAQDQAMSEAVILSRKEYEHMQDQLKECADALKYVRQMVKVGFMANEPLDNGEGYAYIFFDQADLSVVEQAEEKLKEMP